ncbi:hypothetical protein [Chamaesiphon minutus]|uniref:P pilus assembly protein, chaperone PapD n=1 Tax=Chamaesiphon minutus (strain ATCC 27169 / PCC 6605) TaxID=1173020 RepID=K9UN39_CHAP6|nr:hypothetical protein [Chamaesiphon minutus]AFY95614.1 hypothetical protein Cha6605_4698 [Chamaesiphon minutus PCC 6605]
MIAKWLVRISWCGLSILWCYPHQLLAQVPTGSSINNPAIYEDDRVKIVIQNCSRTLENLVCKAILTSKNSDRTVNLSGDNIRLVDFEGNEYYPSSIRLANRIGENNEIKTELIENIPFKASFVFTKIPTNLNQVALLQIPLSGDVDTTAKFRNFSVVGAAPVATKVKKPAIDRTAAVKIPVESSGDDNLVCPERTKILYRATSKSFLMYICGPKNPTHYVGLSRDGSQGITLRLRYYDRTQFSADNGDTNYTIAANRLVVRKDNKIIYQEKIQVLQALPGTISVQENTPNPKVKKNPTLLPVDINRKRSSTSQSSPKRITP